MSLFFGRRPKREWEALMPENLDLAYFRVVAVCSICGLDYDGALKEDQRGPCPHVAGRFYAGERCEIVVKEALLTEVALDEDRSR